MNQISAYVQRINEVYLDLVIEQAALNDTGQYSDVLMVNDSLAFRFPRYADAAARLPTEVAVLEGIQPHLPLRVPDPIYRSLETLEVGKAFVGYALIPGEPLTREVVQAIRDEVILDRLATQLGAFLKALHTILVEQVVAVNLPRAETREDYVSMYDRIQRKLFHLMRPDARAQVSHHFEAFLDNPRHFDYTPVLRHGDFGTFNLLFDRTVQSIIGVLDFGGAALGDPAVDFAGIMSPVGYGESFLRRCFHVYPEIETMMDRVRFYVGTFALEEALFGVEHGDQEAFRAGMETYI